MKNSLKRHHALIELSRDHHQGLLLAMVLKKDSPPYKGMPQKAEDKAEYFKAHFETELAPHFKQEEGILFPFVSGKNKELDNILGELIKEHRKIEGMVRDLPDVKDLITHLDESGKLLESHIRKEERILFQKIQELFSEKELEELSSKMSTKNQN